MQVLVRDAGVHTLPHHDRSAIGLNHALELLRVIAEATLKACADLVGGF